MNYRRRLILALTLLQLTFAGDAVLASWQASDQQDPIRGSGGYRRAPVQLERIALSTIAKRTASALGDLQVEASSTLDLPLTGKIAHRFSVRDKRSGTLHDVVLDAGGKELDRDQLSRDEKAAQTARYGRLDRALAERLDSADESELVLVQIQVVEPDDDDSLPKQTPMTSEMWKQMSEKEKRAFEVQEEATVQQRRKLLASRAYRLVEPLIKRLADLNYECKTEESVPIFYVRLPKRMIQQVATWPEVARIFLVGTSRPTLDVSRNTIGADS
jgi:hypothetical protein